MTRRIVLVDIGSGLSLSGVLPSVALHDPYNARVIARNGVAPYTYTTDDVLPDGMALDSATGFFSATDVASGGTYAITVRATDLTGAYVTRVFVIQVVIEPLSLSGHAPDGTAGIEQSYTYTPRGGTPPRTYSLVGAPEGWSIPDPTEPTVVMIPTSAGTKSWRVRVVDSAETVFDYADSATFEAPTVELTGTYPAVTVGAPYSAYLVIVGGDGDYTLTGGTGVVAGVLPSGLTLSIDGDHLVLEGTATGSDGTVDFTVGVDSGDGSSATSAQSVEVVLSRYWRVLISATNGHPEAALQEIELHSVIGGPIVTTPSTPCLASSTADPVVFPASCVVDRNTTSSTTNCWVSAAVALPHWVWIDLGTSPPPVREVVLWPENFPPFDATRSPKDFIIQSSSDAVNWIDRLTLSGETGWSKQHPRTYLIP
jgi:hypothetical protein